MRAVRHESRESARDNAPRTKQAALAIVAGPRFNGPMNTIAVVGAGAMGAGIAQLAAQHGCSVLLIDVSDSAVQRGLTAIRDQLDRAVGKGKLAASERDDVIARIRPSTAIEGLSEIALAIEAVVEDIAVKRQVFAALERATRETAILATNTSSLSVSAIAEGVTRRGRVIGMHFFNPPVVMPLVEIIAGADSSQAALDKAFEIALSWGKTPVRAKDTPGFIVNRVARGYYLEALRLLGEGVAGVDEIDMVMRTLGGFRMGPFELMDLVGLDVNLAVSTSVWEQMNRHPRFAPHAIQQKLVSEGHLGRKTGRGFYMYPKEGPPLPAVPVNRRTFPMTPLLSDTALAFCTRAGATSAGSTEHFIFARILGAILNEAGFALSEGVASRGDIDLAMLKGTNYPKGPLAWADEIGPRTVRGLLKALNAVTTDQRYEPSPHFAAAY